MYATSSDCLKQQSFAKFYLKTGCKGYPGPDTQGQAPIPESK